METLLRLNQKLKKSIKSNQHGSTSSASSIFIFLLFKRLISFIGTRRSLSVRFLFKDKNKKNSTRFSSISGFYWALYWSWHNSWCTQTLGTWSVQSEPKVESYTFDFPNNRLPKQRLRVGPRSSSTSQVYRYKC